MTIMRSIRSYRLTITQAASRFHLAGPRGAGNHRTECGATLTRFGQGFPPSDGNWSATPIARALPVPRTEERQAGTDGTGFFGCIFSVRQKGMNCHGSCPRPISSVRPMRSRVSSLECGGRRLPSPFASMPCTGLKNRTDWEGDCSAGNLGYRQTVTSSGANVVLRIICRR
jgi:hypothetical protein